MNTWNTHGISLTRGIGDDYFKLRKETGWVIDPCGAQSRDVEIYDWKKCRYCGEKFWASNTMLTCDDCKHGIKNQNRKKLRLEKAAL